MPKETTEVSTLPRQEEFTGREGLVYARVSSKKQELEGSGLDSQEARCVQDLRSIHVPHIKSFRDSYSGGGDFMKRPAMRELLSYIDANPHKQFVVVFDDLKRFARDAMFHFQLRTEFKKRDVILRCLNYKFDESEEGEFVELIIAGHAELERKQNRRQVIQKMKARLEQGYWPFARKRGYNMVRDPMHGKIASPSQEGREVLKPALEAFARGDLPRRIDFSRYLLEHGFWNGKVPEKYLDQSKVILSDPFYAGFVEYEPWGVKRHRGWHEALISPATFEKIQRRMKRTSATKRVRKDLSEDFPVRGLIKCTCGVHMTASWSKGRNGRYGYYFCINRDCPEYRKSIPADTIEGKFKKAFKQTKLTPEVSKVMLPIFDRVWKSELAEMTNRENIAARDIKEVEDEIRELTTLARRAKNDITRGVYEKQIEEAAYRLEQAQGLSTGSNTDFSVPYRTALGKATTLLKNPYAVWKDMGIEEQHGLFFFIFDEKLTYDPKSGYRTAETPTAIRLFEEFSEENSDNVDRTGFEPATPSLQMRCSTN